MKYHDKDVLSRCTITLDYLVAPIRYSVLLHYRVVVYNCNTNCNMLVLKELVVQIVSRCAIAFDYLVEVSREISRYPNMLDYLGAIICYCVSLPYGVVVYNCNTNWNILVLKEYCCTNSISLHYLVKI